MKKVSIFSSLKRCLRIIVNIRRAKIIHIGKFEDLLDSDYSSDPDESMSDDSEM